MGCWNIGLNSFQKWNIGNHIREILINDEQIIQQVNTNIYPIVAPENTDGDFIVYRRMSYGKNTVKNGVYQDTCEVALIAICDDYDKSVELASKIDNALSGKHILSNGFKFEIMLNDSTEMFEDNKFIQTLNFNIK